MSNSILLLDDKIINLIAAGEVIESPASIVKELIENSIDSGADNILLEIKDGGKSYIRVTDNGCGINEEEIPFAFKKHYTSKIKTYDDFLRVKSNGFRGEALPSISIASDVKIISKTRDSNYAIEAKIKNGNIINIEKTGANNGTTIICKDIFLNVPARRNFLKSNQVEARKITEYMLKFAISNIDISFKYINNNKIIFQTYGTNNIKETISLLFDREFDNSLIGIDENISKHILITGAIGNNSAMLSSRRAEYLFINNRIIKNKSIIDCIEEAYSNYIPKGNFPVFFINLKINPLFIDVNVHPNKLNIKFSEEVNIYKLLEDYILKKLESQIMIPKISNLKKKDNYDINFNKDNILEQLKLGNDTHNDKKRIEFTDIISNNSLYSVDSNINIQPLVFEEDEEYISDKDFSNINKTDFDFILSNAIFKGRIFNTYIILEYEKNLYLIDQHAAHERILFEKFMENFKNSSKNTQRLLIPFDKKIPYESIDVLDSIITILEESGYDCQMFGDNIILIRGIPDFFDEKEAFLYIDNVISIYIKEKISNEIIRDKIASKACKSAIKGNQFSLKIEEINKLIEDLNKCKNKYSCPHGRPIIIEIEQYTIEKLFKRVI